MRKSTAERPCAGHTKGDYVRSYPCALNARTGSEFCRYHDPKIEPKPARMPKWLREQKALTERTPADNA